MCISMLLCMGVGKQQNSTKPPQTPTLKSILLLGLWPEYTKERLPKTSAPSYRSLPKTPACTGPCWKIIDQMNPMNHQGLSGYKVPNNVQTKPQCCNLGRQRRFIEDVFNPVMSVLSSKKTVPNHLGNNKLRPITALGRSRHRKNCLPKTLCLNHQCCLA